MSEQTPEIDLSGVELSQLQAIQNAVVRQIALAGRQGTQAGAVHDSHSSSHGKNSVVGLEDVVQRLGGQLRAPVQGGAAGQALRQGPGAGPEQ